MSEKKLCPMGMSRNSLDEGTAFCQEGECAWWVQSSEDCAILAIANYTAAFWLTTDNEIERRKKEGI